MPKLLQNGYDKFGGVQESPKVEATPPHDCSFCWLLPKLNRARCALASLATDEEKSAQGIVDL
ncbi:hypothetical protein DTL42_23595 [Bremerella cremea]|uniref:Uncharacterized protein n=1 Tax=Bremerella cremea TaxID=1031537 RepID=A0A368KNK6_9BACT|nr:hypothetical protein DTL42_23595 [Bremerella cremea]